MTMLLKISMFLKCTFLLHKLSENTHLDMQILVVFPPLKCMLGTDTRWRPIFMAQGGDEICFFANT